MKKTIKRWAAVVVLSCLFLLMQGNRMYAAGGEEEYITITVDAEDDNDNITYSLDSMNPDSFTDSNQFTIPAGTSHTIYVRDAAGNITSKEYTPSAETETAGNITETSSDTSYTDTVDTQDITIDLEIENKKDYSSYEYLTDLPAEPGNGTLYDKVHTDGSNDSDRVFYTVTTAEGDVFYMVIDQNQNTDNVYLLNTVTREDLTALAAQDEENSGTAQDKEEDNLLAVLSAPNEKDTRNDDTVSNSGSGTNRANMILMLVVIAVGGGVYYYLKVYKNKKDEAMDIMEAMDMEDFEPEQEDEEEAEFETDDGEKQEYLDRLINEDDDEALYEADPDEYFPDLDGHGEEAIPELEEDMIFPEEASPVADFEDEYDEELDGEEQ